MTPEANEITNKMLVAQIDNAQVIKRISDTSSELSDGGTKITPWEAEQTLPLILSEIATLEAVKAKLLKIIETGEGIEING